MSSYRTIATKEIFSHWCALPAHDVQGRDPNPTCLPQDILHSIDSPSCEEYDHLYKKTSPHPDLCASWGKNQQEGVEWNKHWGGFVWWVGFLRGKCEDKLNWSGLEDISRFQGERLRRKSALYVSSRVCQLVPFSMGCWQRHALGAGHSVYTTIRKFTGDTRANQNIQGQLCA